MSASDHTTVEKDNVKEYTNEVFDPISEWITGTDDCQGIVMQFCSEYVLTENIIILPILFQEI